MKDLNWEERPVSPYFPKHIKQQWFSKAPLFGRRTFTGRIDKEKQFGFSGTYTVYGTDGNSLAFDHAQSLEAAKRLGAFIYSRFNKENIQR